MGAILGTLLAIVLTTGNVELQSTWPAGIQRTWVGPDYWANRLQDWRVRDGRLECVEADHRFPLRTLFWLTCSTTPEPGTLTMSIGTGRLAQDGATPTGWTGFLIGAGGSHVDHRLTAQVHHRPAQDGGLLAVVDPFGRVAFRDNWTRAPGGGGWSIGGPLTQGEAMAIAPASSHQPAADHPIGAMDLNLIIEPMGDAYRLHLSASDASSGAALGRAVLENVPAERVDGGLALVSHRARSWFGPWKVAGSKLQVHDQRAFGPVLALLYTVSDGQLNATAQMGPLGRQDTQTASLQVFNQGKWQTVATSDYVDDSCTFHFRVAGWDATRPWPIRVAYDLALGGGLRRPTFYEGLVTAEPNQDDFVVASLNCHKVFTGGLRWNHDGIWFPHAELVKAVGQHGPDLLFFAGDQIYEGDLDPAQRQPQDKAILDYLYKWQRWCWAFGGLTRRIPTVTIPDDHDVYHGNLWGAGGRRAVARDGMTAQDAGGYRMSPRFVNAVHRTQTGHLPPPFDPEPIGDGYTTYFTRLNWGGVGFAILADRQFKSSPTVMIPEGQVKNGWFQNPDFDPVTSSDVPGAVLLGERQLQMLRQWATDFSHNVWMNVVLSQTLFANVATLPEDDSSDAVVPKIPIEQAGVHPTGHRLAADADSNGWPQSGRNRALRQMQRCAAVHLAGDQHLGSLIQYGIEDWRDAGYAFCSPAIANTWPRRWWPAAAGQNRQAGAPLYTGDFRDGFGNYMTVYAVANPIISGQEPAALYDRMPGYGIVRFDRKTRQITFECWPRWVDPTAPAAMQYSGWPRTIKQSDNGPLMMEN
jgi:hypothetical protein